MRGVLLVKKNKIDPGALQFVISNQIKKDHFEERRQLFLSKLATAPWPLRWLYHRLQGTKGAPYLALLYGWIQRPSFFLLKKFCPTTLEGQKNDSEMMDRLKITMDQLGIQRWKAHSFPLQNLLRPPFYRSGPTLAILRRLCRKYPLYVVMRVAEALCFYAELVRYVRSHQPNFLMISSEGNPPGLAALGVSRSLGTPVVYVAHAPHVVNPAKIDCSVGVFWGQHSLQEFLSVGSNFQKTFLMGSIARETIPHLEKTHICFCLSKSVNQELLLQGVELCEQEGFKNRIIVRPHPNSFVSRKQLIKILGNKAQVSSDSLDHDLGRSSLCIAGGSSVHLESLSRGVPTIQLEKIDGFEDLNHLTHKKISIPRASNIKELKSILHDKQVLDLNVVGDYFNNTQSFAQFEAEFCNYLKSLESLHVEPL